MANYNEVINRASTSLRHSNTNVIGDCFQTAYDNDQSNWEYEEITLMRGPTGLGFTVAGGTDNPHYKNDSSIYITRFVPNGPAAVDGRLKLEDIIVRVDDTDLNDVSHSKAVDALKNSQNRVQLLIKRKKPAQNVDTTDVGLKTSPNIAKLISRYQQSANNNFKHSPNNVPSPKIFTSTLNSSITDNHNLPPLPKAASSVSARGSTYNSSLRDKSSNLKGASSSVSLQQQQTPPPEDTNLPNYLNRENVNSKSTSAINFETAKNIPRLPRTVILQRTSKGLGFNIVGGVAGGGTFISYIVHGGSAERSNKLHCGDQIMSVNGADLRYATHEEAASALKQSGQTVKLVVKYRPEEYIKFENRINDIREKNMISTGTLRTSRKRSLYARALFDYDPSKDSGLPSRGLPFKFGDILHITNASDDEWWQARRVLENGQDDYANGIIPSSKKLEKRERSRLKSVKFTGRNSSETTLDRRRKKIYFSRRFPFMKSRENLGADFDELEINGSQSNSRGILSASSTTSINNANSERGSIKNDAEEVVLSYEPVLLQEINYKRPVALYGLKEEVEGLREDLACDGRFSFYKMELIVPYTSRPRREGEVDGVKYHFVTRQEMERDLAEHKFVEAGKLNDNLYGTSIDSIREVAESGKHCLLNVSPNAIKRLHEANIYPVVIFIKPKSIESLLEMNKRWSHSEAIAAMDFCHRLEQEYSSYFTSTVSQDTPDEVYNEVLKIIEQQQQPRIWIPTTMETATG